MSVFLTIAISSEGGLTHNKPLLVKLVYAGNENVGKLSWLAHKFSPDWNIFQMYSHEILYRTVWSAEDESYFVWWSCDHKVNISVLNFNILWTFGWTAPKFATDRA